MLKIENGANVMLKFRNLEKKNSEKINFKLGFYKTFPSTEKNP